MSFLADAEFVDLYLGDGFADVKGMPGQPRRIAAPAEWQSHLQELQARCTDHFQATQEPEFSLVLDDLVLRVTYLQDVHAKPLFVLNKSSVKILPLDNLGLPEDLHRVLLSESIRGLVFICGEMGSGKTSSAASIVKARLEAHGGTAITVEDPPEPLLHGEHGPGRCIQIPVSRKQGGYEEALIRALRTRADLILVGEVRDTPTAVQVVQASINGHLIICTGHSGSAVSGIERLAILAQPQLANAYQVLARGLIAVIHQSLNHDTGNHKQLTLQCLSFSGDDGASIREKVRANQLTQLEQDIANQSARSLWNDQ